MATEAISVDHDAGAGAAVRFGDPVTGKVFDFSLLAFVTLTGGANEALVLTEVAANNKGTGLSTYYAGYDASRVHRGPVPRLISVDVHDSVSPPIGSVPLFSVSQPVQFGTFGAAPVELRTVFTPMQAECYSVQMSTTVLCQGQAISMFSGGRAQFTATAATDRINSVAHGLSALDVVCFNTTNALPAGLSINTPYYVRNPVTDTFQVSLTPAGSIIDITGTGTGIHVWDNPSVTITVRAVGAAATTFTKTIKLDSYRGTQFDGQYPDGRVCTFSLESFLGLTAHALTLNEPITFSVAPGGTMPVGTPLPILEGRVYYALPGVDPNSFQVNFDKFSTSPMVFSAPTGELRVYNGSPALVVGRQYAVTTALTMSGQTVTQSSGYHIPRETPNRFTEIQETRLIDSWSTGVQAIVPGFSNLTTLVSSTGVRLHASQPSYPPAKAGDAMTLTTAERLMQASYPDASTKITAIHNKLPSRAYLAGTTAATGALLLIDQYPPHEKHFWANTTPVVAGLTPGQVYTIELLDDTESQIWAWSGSPGGWILTTDPSYGARYVAGNLTLAVTATAGGVLPAQALPSATYANGTRIRFKLRAGASPALNDVEVHPRWRLSRSTAEPVLSLSPEALQQFANDDTGLTVAADGSICTLAGGGVIRPATDLILLDTTVQTVTDAKTFILVGGSASFDNSFNGSLILLYDVSAANAVDPNTVRSWDKDTRTLVVQSTPLFTVAPGDRIMIMATEGTSYSPTGRYVVR